MEKNVNVEEYDLDPYTMVNHGGIYRISLANLSKLTKFLRDNKIYVVYEKTSLEKLYICREMEFQQQEGLHVK